MRQEERRKMLNELIDIVVNGGDIITTRQNILAAWENDVDDAWQRGILAGQESNQA